MTMGCIAGKHDNTVSFYTKTNPLFTLYRTVIPINQQLLDSLNNESAMHHFAFNLQPIDYGPATETMLKLAACPPRFCMHKSCSPFSWLREKKLSLVYVNLPSFEKKTNSVDIFFKRNIKKREGLLEKLRRSFPTKNKPKKSVKILTWFTDKVSWGDFWYPAPMHTAANLVNFDGILLRPDLKPIFALHPKKSCGKRQLRVIKIPD